MAAGGDVLPGSTGEEGEEGEQVVTESFAVASSTVRATGAIGQTELLCIVIMMVLALRRCRFPRYWWRSVHRIRIHEVEDDLFPVYPIHPSVRGDSYTGIGNFPKRTSCSIS